MRHLILFVSLFIFFGFNQKFVFEGEKTTDLSGKADHVSSTKINKQNLYIIQRNKNRNTVFYDLNVLPNGDVYSPKPIDCYWKMYEKNGTREELTTFEKLTAYGYDIQKGSKGDYSIKMNSLKDRVCVLTRDKSGLYSCVTHIGGKKSSLKRIYVYTVEGYIMTTVKYIELFGKDAFSGADTYEKVVNN
jgi:hypothetical protein